jgi:hypothetical protein
MAEEKRLTPAGPSQRPFASGEAHRTIALNDHACRRPEPANTISRAINPQGWVALEGGSAGGRMEEVDVLSELGGAGTGRR